MLVVGSYPCTVFGGSWKSQILCRLPLFDNLHMRPTLSPRPDENPRQLEIATIINLAESNHKVRQWDVSLSKRCRLSRAHHVSPLIHGEHCKVLVWVFGLMALESSQIKKRSDITEPLESAAKLASNQPAR